MWYNKDTIKETKEVVKMFKSKKTMKQIKSEIREIFNISPEVFDSMSYAEIRRIYRKTKIIDGLYTDVLDFVETKKNPKNIEKPLDKSSKV